MRPIIALFAVTVVSMLATGSSAQTVVDDSSSKLSPGDVKAVLPCLSEINPPSAHGSKFLPS
jgi:hypothetical protein